MRIDRKAVMVLLTLATALCMTSSVHAHDSKEEAAVKAYYAGFVDKDWNMVASALAPGFTFTTPATDNDHMPLEKFKQECWPTSKFLKTAHLTTVFESGGKLAVQVEMTTTDNKIVRNLDVYEFDSTGKIKAIEVYFGRGAGGGYGYPGNNSK